MILSPHPYVTYVGPLTLGEWRRHYAYASRGKKTTKPITTLWPYVATLTPMYIPYAYIGVVMSTATADAGVYTTDSPTELSR